MSTARAPATLKTLRSMPDKSSFTDFFNTFLTFIIASRLSFEFLFLFPFQHPLLSNNAFYLFRKNPSAAPDGSQTELTVSMHEQKQLFNP
jgi:hypothetical protein